MVLQEYTIISHFIMYWLIKLLIIVYQLLPLINYWLIKLLFISCTSTHLMCIYFPQFKYPTSTLCPYPPPTQQTSPMTPNHKNQSDKFKITNHNTLKDN